MKQPYAVLSSRTRRYASCMSQNDLLGVKQDDQMLGQEPQGIHYQVLFSQPNGADFRNTEFRADHADIDVGQFVRITKIFDPPRTGDFRHGGGEAATPAVQMTVLLKIRSPATITPCS